MAEGQAMDQEGRMDFKNAYDDLGYAAAYAKLEFPGTYYLAYRDLPELFDAHATGVPALDFGCGAGRSTRFLRRCGFRATGIDISDAMIGQALALDPDGDYRLITDGNFSPVASTAFDLILAAFTFDNIPTMARKVDLFKKLRGLLAPNGRIVMLGSTPDIYVNEWASFTTKEFLAENRRARSGDIVRIINTAVEGATPVEDILWTDDAYQEAFRGAGLTQAVVHRPLGKTTEPEAWVNETRIAPWVIYVLKAK
jgi:SAM-dependent methyltransferase